MPAEWSAAGDALVLRFESLTIEVFDDLAAAQSWLRALHRDPAHSFAALARL
jgi:hypothetical protein